MPMFIITGSMIRHAISSPRSSSSRSSTVEVVERHDVRVALEVLRDAERHRRRRRLLAAAHQVGVRARRRTSPGRGGRGTSPRSSRCRRGRSPRARRGSRSSSLRCRSSRSAPARGGSAGTAPRRTAPCPRSAPRSACRVRAARVIASTIFGCAWPTTMQPKPPWVSTYSLPSTSHTCAPLPLAQVDRDTGRRPGTTTRRPAAGDCSARSYSAFDSGRRASEPSRVLRSR